MYDQFNKLKTIKKRTIINAAIQEFVKNGFDHASTNEIVKKANISKGRSEEHTSELQSRGHLVCRLLLEKKKRRANDQVHQASAVAEKTTHSHCHQHLTPVTHV